MMGRMLAEHTMAVALPLLLLLDPGAVTSQAAGPATPVGLRVEALRVGPGGTETLSSDEARVLPGQGALLVKEVTLSSPAPARKGSEKISLRAEIRVDSFSPSGLVVTVRSRVNVLATTGGIPLPRSEIRREATADVAGGTSQLFEVYTSAALDTKVVLNVRWFPAEEGPGAEGDPVPIPLIARVYEVEGGETILMSQNQLLAAVGGTAAATFNRIVPLSDSKLGEKRIRQDRMELTLSPRFKAGRSLSLTLEAAGEVVTRTVEGDLSHPLAHRAEILLSPGTPSVIDLEVASEDTNKEGWDRVRFRLEITAGF
jgi:hypothetical protein